MGIFINYDKDKREENTSDGILYNGINKKEHMFF